MYTVSGHWHFMFPIYQTFSLSKSFFSFLWIHKSPTHFPSSSLDIFVLLAIANAIFCLLYFLTGCSWRKAIDCCRQLLVGFCNPPPCWTVSSNNFLGHSLGFSTSRRQGVLLHWCLGYCTALPLHKHIFLCYLFFFFLSLRPLHSRNFNPSTSQRSFFLRIHPQFSIVSASMPVAPKSVLSLDSHSECAIAYWIFRGPRKICFSKAGQTGSSWIPLCQL